MGISYTEKKLFLSAGSEIEWGISEDEEKVVEPSADAFRHALSRACGKSTGAILWTKLQMERNP